MLRMLWERPSIANVVGIWRELRGIQALGGDALGSQATDMLVKERSRLTRKRSTRNYYIGAGWAGRIEKRQNYNQAAYKVLSLDLPSCVHLLSIGI